MLKIIIITLFVNFAAATTQPIHSPAFPEDVPRRNRIINGWPATQGQFPHQVRLTSPISSTMISVCGGSIISDRFILTACHCVQPHNTFTLGFGLTDFHNPSVIQTSNKKIEHSGYNPSNLNNDIALIQTPSTIAWSRLVAPITLPRYSQASTSFIDQQATVSGFGKTRDSSQISYKLMYGYVRVINNSECSAVYGTGVVREFTLCTYGWSNYRQGTCSGDSGGPLIAFDSSWGRSIQLGVVSFVSSRGCESGAPAGFVRVSSYLTWITQNTGIVFRA